MMEPLISLLDRGGPALWVIAGLSVLTLALILWKLWRLALDGAWRRGPTERAVALWQDGQRDAAQSALEGQSGWRARVAKAALSARATLPDDDARDETARVARGVLLEARTGLRALELVVTIAPLIGLLGTVLGMIDAFQALQAAGNQNDPAALAGGIWEALLTTAAGMAVAIPAGIALAWFDSVADRLAHDLEDIAARLFTASVAD